MRPSVRVVLFSQQHQRDQSAELGVTTPVAEEVDVGALMLNNRTELTRTMNSEYPGWKKTEQCRITNADREHRAHNTNHQSGHC